MNLPGRLLLLGLLVPSGCASRSLPSSYPANAASSAQAPEAKLASVTMALSGEPPLPGEPAGAWSALAEPGGQGEPAAGDAGDPHAGHDMHGGHHHGPH